VSEATNPPRRRRRRTADEARRAILEAAQKRLAECGPEEIRLQDIAADLGISHPAILHHFGSREVLMRELSRHAFESLNADLVAALGDDAGGSAVGGWLERVFETLRDRGHARLLAWATLTRRLEGSGPDGPTADDDPHLLLDLARAVQARREANAAVTGSEPPPFEEALFAVQLVAAALLGDALIGGVLRRSAGISSDAATQERFRRWLADHVTGLLIPDDRR
jgi:AcrR family transcriptional regulator